MPTAPSLPGTPSGESPADRALALALAGEIDSALRWSAALAKSESAAPLGILITARLLAAGGRREVGIEGFEVAIGRAIDAGNLPLAVAAVCDLAGLGADPDPQLDAIARAFSKDSPRLLKKGATPPELPRSAQQFQPLPAALAGKALLGKAQEIIHEAKQLYDQEKAARPSEPKVVQPPLFGALTEDELREMLHIFETVTVPSGAVVIEEGTPGAEAYILARGELEVRRRVHEEKPETMLL